jgi:hypothetical protein
MMNFKADFYRIAVAFVSTKGAHDYLQGVHVEPCAAGGVLLVATDGHRLICIRDELGQADCSGIVKLTPEVLKLCRSKSSEERRCVQVDGEYASVVLGSDIIGTSKGALIDGTFPDWRRVVPKPLKAGVSNLVQFDSNYLISFAKAALELEKMADGKAGAG